MGKGGADEIRRVAAARSMWCSPLFIRNLWAAPLLSQINWDDPPPPKKKKRKERKKEKKRKLKKKGREWTKKRWKMTEFVTFFLRERSYLVCFYAFLHVSGVEKHLKFTRKFLWKYCLMHYATAILAFPTILKVFLKNVSNAKQKKKIEERQHILRMTRFGSWHA